MEDLERRRELGCVRRWCSQSRNGNARSVAAEGAAVVGHGVGDAVATAREAVELFAPPDGIEVFHYHAERERERERDIRKKKKVVGSGVVCCRVLSARP